MAGIGSAANFIPEVWSKELQIQREANLVMANHVDRWDDEVKSFGDTIHMPMVANRTALTKVAGTTVAFRASTEGQVVIGITTQAYDADIIEDMAQVQSKYNLMQVYTKKFGYSIAAKVDSDLLGLYASVAQTIGASASNVGIGYTNIIRGNRLLDAANAPKEDRFLIVDPIGYEQLLQITNFVRYDAVGQADSKNPINNGRIGRVFGIDVFESTQVANNGSIIFGLMWQKDAIALALQKDVQVKSQYSPRDIGWELVVYNIYGYGLVRTDHAVVLQYGNVGTGVG